MILLKVILTGLFAAFAVLAGLFVAAVSVLVLLVRRWVGRNPPVAPAASSPLPLRREPRSRSADEVIEVMATEVPATEVPADPAVR